MILRKIKLENFRQFKGVQELSFEAELPNITIIYGENKISGTINNNEKYALLFPSNFLHK